MLTFQIGVGFGFLAFWWIFNAAGSAEPFLTTFILTAYYIFFCLFMLAVAFRIKFIIEYCGFLNDPPLKSVFYLM